MNSLRYGGGLLVLLALASAGRAGLYYSGEVLNPLPSQWRGFLLDQRLLRTVAVPASGRNSASRPRLRYQEAAAQLERLARHRKLSAEETADLGALHLRLGQVDKAIEVLRAGQRAFPRDFAINANLGTAFQVQGELAQAAACLTQAVRLAPGKYQPVEEIHLKLVRLRQRQGRDARGLDDLFGVKYGGDKDRYEPGKLAAAEQKKLPADAVAIMQQLALGLPADGRLLWQLAELANAYGDVRTAAGMMDGCVTQFGLHDPELRRHRQILRAAADELARNSATGSGAKSHNGGHNSRLPARSRRPLVTRLDAEKLPPISATGVNTLPWSVLTETTVDRQYRPTFASYLKDLDGKKIALSGFMQPLSEEGEGTSFMLIEYPVGCWYCEMPEMTGIVFVELTDGRAANFTRGLVKVVGTLKLNAKDPENFLFTIQKARVAEAD